MNPDHSLYLGLYFGSDFGGTWDHDSMTIKPRTHVSSCNSRLLEPVTINLKRVRPLAVALTS